MTISNSVLKLEQYIQKCNKEGMGWFVTIKSTKYLSKINLRYQATKTATITWTNNCYLKSGAKNNLHRDKTTHM